MASRRSFYGLDWFAFFVADIQTGWGPFVAAPCLAYGSVLALFEGPAVVVIRITKYDTPCPSNACVARIVFAFPYFCYKPDRAGNEKNYDDDFHK